MNIESWFCRHGVTSLAQSPPIICHAPTASRREATRSFSSPLAIRCGGLANDWRRLWSLVTSSGWKYFFLDYLHTIVPYPMSNWGYLWKFIKFWNFQKWRNFEVLANFFVGSVTGNWVCYINSQVHYLHFELLIDALAQILTELWWFQNLTYFLTSWPNYLTFDLHNKWVSSDDQDTHLGQDWWWLVQRCDLYPANNVHPDKQTNKQTDWQTVRRTYK